MEFAAMETFETSAQWSQLLDRVEGGESITITRHGTPVAKLVPVQRIDREDARTANLEWKRLRAGNRLGSGVSVKVLKGKGRR